jgi:PAS domain S-box-containing protein
LQEADILHTQVTRLAEQLARLSDRALGENFAAYPLVNESLAELQTALEEMRVGEEEMRVAAEELVAAQTALTGERLRYWRLFEFAPDAYFVTDEMGAIREANRAAAELLGLSREHVRGKPLALYVVEDERRSFRQRLLRLARGQEEEADLTLVGRERGPVRVAFRASVIPGAEGHGEAVLCLMRDLTDRIAAEEQARQLEAERIARAEAERANRVKSDFMAVMSHELRTPLTSIMAYTELLQMGIPAALPDAAQPHLSCIDEASRHLLLLIEEILGFARLEAGREEVKPRPADLRELVPELRTFLQPLAEKRGLELRFSVPEWPVTVVTDRAKVRQILINLLSNAVKFTPAGGVDVELEAQGAGAVFRVRDTGVGIAPQNVERIFEPFWQEQQGTTRNVGGTGLGLAIALQIAQILGGTLTAESDLGRGTTITLRLPAQAPGPDG